MSLRARLVGTISLVLAAVLVFGSGLVYWHAQRKVQIEIDAAMEVARNTVNRSIEELSRSYRPEEELKETIRVFDGDRHVRATLLNARGQAVAVSKVPAPANDMPEWFFDVIAPSQRTEHVELPSIPSPFGEVLLESDARSEVDEVWGDLAINIILLGGFFIIALGIMYVLIGRALAPLKDLSVAMRRVGDGDYHSRVHQKGPPEIVALGQGFNDMTARLADMAERNNRLSVQLTRVQDEERAELARDLHDEVGPFLFAIDVDATGIADLVRRQDEAGLVEIVERSAAIRRSAAHAHGHVRAILGRLRPGFLPNLGLRLALEALFSDWRERNPDLVATVDLDAETYGGDADSVIHAIAREAINNAMRHAAPKAVTVEIRRKAAHVHLVVEDDGGGLARAPGPENYGILGMRERAASIGGSLTVTAVGNPPGVRVAASWPVTPAKPHVSATLHVSATQGTGS